MNIDNSSLYQDILNMFSKRDGESDIGKHYKLEVIFNDTREDVEAIKVEDLSINRDFFASKFDSIRILASFTLFDYMESIYPKRETLRARITETYVNPKTGDRTTVINNRVYTAKLVNNTNLAMTDGDLLGQDVQAKTNEFHAVEMQLIPDNIESLRLVQVGSVVRDTRVSDFLKVFGSGLGELSVSLHEPLDRDDYIKQLIVPEGIGVIDVAEWMQSMGGGVYNYGIGSYILNNTNYIYPLYDIEPKDSRRKVVIVNVGRTEFQGVEVTWIENEGTLNILTTGKVDFSDDSESMEYNEGNAIRFREPMQLDNIVTNSQSGVPSQKGYLNKVTSETPTTGEEGLKFSSEGYHLIGNEKQNKNYLVIDKGITSNTCSQYSFINANRGAIAVLEWSNAELRFIKPNMEVTVLYNDGSEVRAMNGVILGINAKTQVTGTGVNTTHITDAALSIYLGKYES
jgi:hypothetical protein